MLRKRIFWTLLMAGIIITSTTGTQAQSTDRKPSPEGAETTSQEATTVQGGILDVIERQKTAIAGTWLGTFDTGDKFLQTFNADGTCNSSGQGEVSTSRPLGVHTPAHGVWQHLGGRQFGVTLTSIFYDINTGQLNAFGKVRMLLTLEGDGDEMSGTYKLQLLDPNGNIIAALPVGNLSFKRIKFEPLN